MIDTRDIQIIPFDIDSSRILEENIRLKKTNQILVGIVIVGIIFISTIGFLLKDSDEKDRIANKNHSK